MHREKLILHGGLLLSFVLIVFGTTVLIGWHFDIVWLLQYKTNTIAMVYNTALSFVLYGVALILILLNKKQAGFFITLVTVILSILVLSQYLFNLNLNVDNLFITHYVNAANFYPGRMAPNTTVSFILAGIAILLISRQEITFSMAVTASLLAITLGFMSLLFVSGYFTSVQDAYIWSKYTPMALNTAIGFVLLSLVLFLTLFHTFKQKKLSVWQAMPLSVGLSMFFINSLLALAVLNQQKLNHIQSVIPLIILVLGTIFTLLFSLMFHYFQSTRRFAANEKNLRALTEATLEATNDGIIAWNANGVIVNYNQKFLYIWNLNADELANITIYELLEKMAAKVDNQSDFIHSMKTLMRPTQESNQLLLHLSDKRYINVSMQTKKDRQLPYILVLSFHDVSIAKTLENEMIHRNTHDSLTGLPNKSFLIDLLKNNIRDARRNNFSVGVFLIDVNRFTHINDLFGRSSGDRMISMIADRLNGALESYGTLCRLGGDEFLLIAPLRKKIDGDNIVKKVVSAMKACFNFQGKQLTVSCSIGIAVAPADSSSAEDLLRFADIAMIRAKQLENGNFAYYSNELSHFTYERMLLENELYIALEEKQFEIYFQPLVDLSNQKTVAFEALLRWHNPRHGLVAPDKFLSIAYELGMMVDIGRYVLNEVCSQIKKWMKQGLPLITVSINVTSHQFFNNQLINDIEKSLDLYQLPPSALEIELTEQTLIKASNDVFSVLTWLKNKKIAIALDDFGTGYSSLNYIKNFPLDKIKIDASFTRDILVNKQNKELLKAIIHMAKILKLSVLAEGIEKQEQFEFLKKNHCDYGQGYWFAKPMPAAEVVKYMKRMI